MATWMDLEDITLNKISQSEKDKPKMNSGICCIYKEENQVFKQS